MSWELIADWRLWLVLTFGLGMLQMLTDEFFFGGAAIGAFITAATVASYGAEIDALNHAGPLVIFGVAGILGGCALKMIGRRMPKPPPDINEQPYRGDGE